MPRTLTGPKVTHPLAHCEAAKAYYYDWVEKSNQYPVGNRIRTAANEEYKYHLATCEVCIEVLEGLYAKNKKMYPVQANVTAG